jgi:hypothetical protein
MILGVGAVDGEVNLLAAKLGDLLGEGEGGHGCSRCGVGQMRMIAPGL